MIKLSLLLSHGSRVAVLVAAVLLSGCTPTYQVVLDRPAARGDTLPLTRLNNRLSDPHVTVRQVTGEETEGTYLRTSQDSCYLLTNDRSIVPTVVGTTDITSIAYRDHVTGLVGGLLAGVRV